MATDTLVSGVHFPATASGHQVATRALCVNLSDMAAMGANPRWFTLALTLPRDKANAEWLADFSAGLGEIASQ
jgi:thiamine-monophosphate kinase